MVFTIKLILQSICLIFRTRHADAIIGQVKSLEFFDYLEGKVMAQWKSVEQINANSDELTNKKGKS